MSCEKCNGIGFVTVPHRDGKGYGETECECAPRIDPASIQAEANDFAWAAKEMTRWWGPRIEAQQIREACEGSATLVELRAEVETLVREDVSGVKAPCGILKVRIRNRRERKENARADQERAKAAAEGLWSEHGCMNGEIPEPYSDGIGSFMVPCPICHPAASSPNDTAATLRETTRVPALMQGE